MTNFILFKITDRSDQIAFPVWLWLHHSLERDWIWRSSLQLHLQRNGWSNILIVSDYDLTSYLLNKGCLRHCYQIEIVSNCSCFYPYGGQGESYGTNGRSSCNVDITCKNYLKVFALNPLFKNFSQLRTMIATCKCCKILTLGRGVVMDAELVAGMISYENITHFDL